MLPEIRECLEADDIYLKHLEYKLGIDVVWVKNKNLRGLSEIRNTQKIRLMNKNVLQCKNDEYLSKFKIIDNGSENSTNTKKKFTTNKAKHIKTPERQLTRKMKRINPLHSFLS
jgi:hypothetical protein